VKTTGGLLLHPQDFQFETEDVAHLLRHRRTSNDQFRETYVGPRTAVMGAKPLSALARQKVSYGSMLSKKGLRDGLNDDSYLSNEGRMIRR
jgi:hypothetical protein